MAAPHQDPPSPVNENADEALCPTEKRLDLVGNNHHLDIDAFNTTHLVIIEILRRHPLCYALTTNVDVPVIYLQQVWFTLRHDVRDNTPMVVGSLDGAAFQLTRDDIQTLLHLPLATDGGRVEFEGLLSDDRICHDVHGLGYSGELTRISKFHRNNLTPLWYVLFSILHRCLSGKTKGMDRCSGNFLRLFHAVAYNRHIDYAAIIWRELVSNVCAKGTGNERTFVPFMRFLQLAIRAHMSVDPTIRRRSGNRTCPHHKMFHLARRQEIPGVVPMRIPHAILNMANPQAQSVREYTESLGLEAAPIVQPGKAGLARGMQPVRRSGPRTRSGGVRPARATGRDVLKGNVRGTGVGRGSRSPGSSSDVAGSSGTACSPSLSPSPSPQRLSPGQEEMEATASKSESKGERSGSGNGDDEEKGEESAQESSSEEFDDEIIPKRRSKRKNDRLSVSQPYMSRVAISTTPPHELGQSIEKDVVDQVTQMYTPPIHSTASQQADVSFSHGIIAHTQLASHLENVGIETREQPPRPSTSFSARWSLGPFAEFSILPRTPLMTSSTLGSANGLTETPIVPPPFDRLRGLGGRPAMVNTTPAMRAGSASVFATVAASTSTLSGLGVRPTEFVSREIMDDALMAVRTELRQEFQEEIQELKRLIKGRDKVTDESVPSSISLSPPPPPPSSTSNMSTVDLKALLFSRLLEECSAPTEYEVDLLSLLRPQSHAQPPYESTAALHATIQAQQETIRMLRERIAYPEETCRSQAQGTKRGHDDQDDPDHHEGEKRQRLDVVDAVSSEVQLTDHQPEATSATPIDTQAQDDDDHAELDAFIVPEVEIIGASADVIQTVEKRDGGDKKVSKDDIEKTDDLSIDLTGG